MASEFKPLTSAHDKSIPEIAAIDRIGVPLKVHGAEGPSATHKRQVTQALVDFHAAVESIFGVCHSCATAARCTGTAAD